jgi:hypothetical protein
MKRTRWHELMYSAAAFEIWAEAGPYKKTPVVREVYIQAKKLVRMLRDEDLGITDAESRGEPVSKSLRKRRGKLTVRVETQFKKLLECAEEAVQLIAVREGGRRLTRLELKQNAAQFRTKILGIIALLKEKYPLETAD